MKSIERRFKNIQTKHPESSSYICFADSINGQNFSTDRIKRNFNRLVSKDDYTQEEKNRLLKNLYSLNKSHINQGK